MDLSQVSDLLREAVGVAIRLGGPLLVLTMLVGVVIAVFQAVTQIHEQSIGFMLKMIVVVGMLLIGGGWMLETLQDFTLSLFDLIAS